MLRMGDSEQPARRSGAAQSHSSPFNLLSLSDCAEVTLRPGRMGAVPHFHHSFDEICRVVEGTVTVLVGERDRYPSWRMASPAERHGACLLERRHGDISRNRDVCSRWSLKALVELFATSATPARSMWI
jgi:hypothetical protein